MELKGKVCVVTGAARGIGRAIALELARQGARLALVDVLADELRQTAEELKGTADFVIAVPTDIADKRQIAAMQTSIHDELGSVDVLVNNAGTFSVIAPVWEADPERWLRDIRVNLCGSFLVCHALVGDMVERKRGYIINMVSSGGVSDPHAYMTSYASSKTGLTRFTEGLAAELEPHDVKVFAVAPPAVLTEMTKFIMQDPGGRKWRPGFEKLFDKGESCPPEVVARMILRLLSGEFDKLSGRYLRVVKDPDAVLSRTDEILERDLLTLRVRTV